MSDETNADHIWGMQSNDFFTALKGQMIRVLMSTGKTVRGEMMGIDETNIILAGQSGPMLIYKTGIILIQPVAEESDG